MIELTFFGLQIGCWSISPRCCRWGRGAHRFGLATMVVRAMISDWAVKSPKTGKFLPNFDGLDDLCVCTKQHHRNLTSLLRIPEATRTIVCLPHVSIVLVVQRTRCLCHDPRPNFKKREKLIKKKSKKLINFILPSPNLMKFYRWHEV